MGAMSRIVVAIILAVYFIFTSGFIFEVTQSKSIDKIDIPYNPALSSERTGIVGVFTKCDIECAKWIVQNTKDTDLVAGDVNSSILLMSFINMLRVRKTASTLVYDYETLPEHCYILVLDWNIKHNLGVRVVGTGTRMSFPLPELDYPVVYKCGNSRILKK